MPRLNHDSQFRHTVDIGLGSNFNRGTSYRCSLQNVSSTRVIIIIVDINYDVFLILTLITTKFQQDNQNDFLRNNRYRSTMQNGLSSPSSSSNRYTYESQNLSKTPTLRSKSGMSHGSSQLSVNSTNPFDEEYDDTISQGRISIDALSIRHSARKKRKAPQPPKSPSSTSSSQVSHRNKFYHFEWN